MSPSASLLLLLLLGLSQAYPLEEEGSEAEPQVDDDDTVDISTRILTSNNATNEILLEGDMLVPRNRNAMKCWTNEDCLWKKASDGLVWIPFTISNQFTSGEKQMMEYAMEGFHQNTCIRFFPRRNENDYISIENNVGCFSFFGRTGGRQKLSLSRPNCVYHDTIQHELNHALGFQHEQTRSDRDYYVQINWENIDPEMAFNFDKQDTNNLNTPYDYSSVMHYGRKVFSIQRGRETITPIPDPNVQIGRSDSLSRWDIKRINLLYKC